MTTSAYEIVCAANLYPITLTCKTSIVVTATTFTSFTLCKAYTNENNDGNETTKESNDVAGERYGVHGSNVMNVIGSYGWSQGRTDGRSDGQTTSRRDDRTYGLKVGRSEGRSKFEFCESFVPLIARSSWSILFLTKYSQS